MTTKDLIIQELDQLPESSLPEILEYIRQVKQSKAQGGQAQIWQAYLTSEVERAEVYRRLADS